MNYQTIKLLGGAEVHIDFDERKTTCQKCGKPIRFGITKNGKKMPICQLNEGSEYWQAHFADCKFAAEFRKSDRLDRIDEEERNQEELNNL